MSAYSHALAMKLLLEGLLVALVLVAELAGLVALATRYTTTETHPSESRGSLAIAVVASEDGGGEAYRRGVWGTYFTWGWGGWRKGSGAGGPAGKPAFFFFQGGAEGEGERPLPPQLNPQRGPAGGGTRGAWPERPPSSD